jgi:hypothetical protein
MRVRSTVERAPSSVGGDRHELKALQGRMVELRGIEPLTSSLRTRRSPN